MSVSSSTPTATTRRFRWRIVDIVVASVIGVASGLIFLAWNAGVLGALVIRKPGAAIYTELLAAVVSALVGNQWGGFLTLEAGFVQGLGAEIIFLIFAYRVWTLPVAILAGAGAALAGGINNLILWYAGADVTFTIVYLISTVISGAVIAGLLSWLLVRALAATGALDAFPAGREVRQRV